MHEDPKHDPQFGSSLTRDLGHRIRLLRAERGWSQEVLAELAGRLTTHGIRGSPLSYLRALIASAQAGTFIPEAGVRVAEGRERQRASKPRSDPAPRASPRVTDPETHLARIRQTLSTETQHPPDCGSPRNPHPPMHR